LREAATEPCLYRRHGPPEALGQRLAAQPAVIGKQHDRAFLLVQFLKAIDERCERLGACTPRERVDIVRGRFEALRLILDRSGTNAARLVERTVAGDVAIQARAEPLTGSNSPALSQMRT
jgi:hypothetical protein